MYLSAIRRRRSLNSQKNNFDNSDDEGCKSCVAFRNYGQKYLETSTLHGLRYIGDKTLSNFERGSFVVSFILVFFVSIYFITNVWQKWSLAPIIIGLNPVSTQIKDIPFPAVTICNMNQAKRSVAQHIKEYVYILRKTFHIKCNFLTFIFKRYIRTYYAPECLFKNGNNEYNKCCW